MIAFQSSYKIALKAARFIEENIISLFEINNSRCLSQLQSRCHNENHVHLLLPKTVTNNGKGDTHIHRTNDKGSSGGRTYKK